MKKIFLIIFFVLSIVLVVALSITLVNAFGSFDFGSDSSIETNKGSNVTEDETSSNNSDVNTSKKVKITVNYNQISQDGEATIANLYNRVEYLFSEGETYEIIHPDYSEQGFFIKGDGHTIDVATEDKTIDVFYYPCSVSYNLQINDNGEYYVNLWSDVIAYPQTVFPIKITNNSSKACSSFTLNAYHYKTDDIDGSCKINEFIIEPGESMAIWPAFHYLSGYTKESSYTSYIKSIAYDTLYDTIKVLPMG